MSNNEEEELYEVEKIVGHAFMNGEDHYKVRWKGFDASDDTWEPASKLECFTHLI